MKNIVNQLRYKLAHIMYGRNGQDQLVMACYLSGMILYICGAIIKNSYVMSAATALFIYGIFRCYSKNLDKRRQENFSFCKSMLQVRNYFKMTGLRLKNGKTHRYFMCRQCGQIVRVPKTGRKIMITCPNCKNKFIRKS